MSIIARFSAWEPEASTFLKARVVLFLEHPPGSPCAPAQSQLLAGSGTFVSTAYMLSLRGNLSSHVCRETVKPASSASL